MDSPLIMESAKSLLLNQSLTLDATPGKLESAQLALKIGSSIPTMSAEQFPDQCKDSRPQQRMVYFMLPRI